MTAEAEFQTLNDAYVACFRRRDGDGCAALFTDHAVLTSPFGPPAHGRAAIAETHRDWVTDEGAPRKAITVVRAGMSGDLGWCLAEFSEGGAVEGTSLNVLERQADGQWRIACVALGLPEDPSPST